MWEFMTKNPGYTLLIVWVVAYFTANAISRFFRSRNIKNHGWPPPHLDADGDFKPEKSEE